MKFFYDLHIHSCLSPCADDDMTPSNIAAMAALKGLNIIALCDHNTAKNCRALAAACSEYGITFIPGMELTAEEEIHIACYFPSVEAAEAFENKIEAMSTVMKNRPDIFGHQLIYSDNDVCIGECEKLLAFATAVSFEDIFPLVEKYGGVAVPAHVDRPSYSVLSVLGALPPDIRVNTFEISSTTDLKNFFSAHPEFSGKSAIHSSDAHTLGLIAEPEHFFELNSRLIGDVLEHLVRGGKSFSV